MNFVIGTAAVAAFALVPVCVIGDEGAGDGLRFEAELAAAQEVALVDSAGTGRATVRFDAAFTQVFVDLRVANLTGAFTRAHFHCHRPGANGPVAFGLVEPGPLVFDGRRVRGTLTNADFNGADCVPQVARPVNNIAALAFAMRDGLVYLNVHTDVYPGGEIRGQLLPQGGRSD